MKNEIKIFFTALMFYTRIPCPKWVGYSEENLNKATRYLPLIGWIVGSFGAVNLWIFSFILPISVAVILSVISTILLTGAFHEDGLADVCDGFGGGWNKEKILEIMKDSRIGAYGVIGLVLTLLLKIVLLTEISSLNLVFGIKTMLLAHILSRFTAVSVIFTHSYARADASSKVKPIAKSLSKESFFIALVITFPAFLLFQNIWIFLCIVPVFLLKSYLAAYFKKWIDGYTGDCLGAVQQLSEVTILLFCTALWKFI